MTDGGGGEIVANSHKICGKTPQNLAATLNRNFHLTKELSDAGSNTNNSSEEENFASTCPRVKRLEKHCNKIRPTPINRGEEGESHQSSNDK